MNELFRGSLAFMAFLIAMVLSKRFCDPSSHLYILDHPNVRSLHDEPTPRGGGLAILAALGITWPLALILVHPPHGLAGLVAGLGMIAAISFLDDKQDVPPVVRLMVQTGAALMLIMAGPGLNTATAPVAGMLFPPGLCVALSTLFVVWFINLYNFMDGMDGFAGGMGVIGFACLSIMGWMAGEITFASLAILVSMANLGFLMLNLPPASIFMGDTGSASMGFLAAAFSLWGVRSGVFPLWIPILVFSPFVVDATVTLIRRLLRREKVWQAHRSHYYQRLVRLGWGHRRTVFREFGLMLAVGISAILLNRLDGIWGLTGILIWAGLYALMAVGVHRLEMRTRVTP